MQAARSVCSTGVAPSACSTSGPTPRWRLTPSAPSVRARVDGIATRHRLEPTCAHVHAARKDQSCCYILASRPLRCQLRRTPRTARRAPPTRAACPSSPPHPTLFAQTPGTARGAWRCCKWRSRARRCGPPSWVLTGTRLRWSTCRPRLTSTTVTPRLSRQARGQVQGGAICARQRSRAGPGLSHALAAPGACTVPALPHAAPCVQPCRLLHPAPRLQQP